ncbi:MAG: hypothetical protein QG667_1754 [Pseudomonadota bacterium]|mgnify:FL=1|nr:hypothetical protein [Pseudomonadota bacterium]
MAKRLLVGTRKGLFVFEPEASSRRWRMCQQHFPGKTVTAVLDDRRSGHWFAALRHNRNGASLYRTVDGGLHWQEENCPEFPADAGPNADGSKPYVDTIWSLAAAGTDEPGVILAGTIPAALFITNDDGLSWGLISSLWDLPARKHWFGHGTSLPGLHSICIHSQDSNQVTVGISAGGVWQTDDGCASWHSASVGMSADYMPLERQQEESIQDTHRLVECGHQPEYFWSQHRSGIYRSNNNAREWKKLSIPGDDFGFTVAVHPKDPNTAWYIPLESDAVRIPRDGEFYVLRTRDGGQSFEKITAGLPAEHAYHVIYRHALCVSDSGNLLAFGSTTGSVWTSADEGGSWWRVSAELPPILCMTFIS